MVFLQIHSKVTMHDYSWEMQSQWISHLTEILRLFMLEDYTDKNYLFIFEQETAAQKSNAYHDLECQC